MTDQFVRVFLTVSHQSLVRSDFPGDRVHCLYECHYHHHMEPWEIVISQIGDIHNLEIAVSYKKVLSWCMYQLPLFQLECSFSMILKAHS